jgi:hypothetical protein
MAPISHLRALEAVPDGLEACVERWSQGSRTRAASLMVSLCRKFQIEVEVATELVKGMSTPVDGPVHVHPGRRKKRKLASPGTSFAGFVENYTSPDRPPPCVTPCRRRETQASYWMNENECTCIVDIDVTRAAPPDAVPKQYTVPSDAYQAILAVLY